MGIIRYIRESYEELRANVTWPSWAEGQNLMVVVAVFSIIFSLAIWGVDTGFQKLISLYFDLIG
ncbi:preprotein translocase subunit SecE [Leptobacterium flavescens]|uniref:Protein translocase subunit SecE n=1 Tax=Leptobacterium flavescens TaxID=472055 RepID=A0A6P0UIV3_9FLAO|nr:preprotein translocase subunit SecE [Leptobacterium flavescens]NER12310.1 preprotein translocase subunit SecE [Leptobacterium flavescens]